ncbi:hypothetical protein EGI22_16090 [Lacihabitans sp. LS3-19]|uniref:hypothetical protein n=1 Tax=Lacihabitans sp. LS3-19 TaxID=2487335 RepID=UPI0020CFAAEB|nr:hypothetical protein [Lacihabitans sp. LS3-19]MCP9769424.1 hypothetical protein [Lacihabitans sp. LS3-19]
MIEPRPKPAEKSSNTFFEFIAYILFYGPALIIASYFGIEKTYNEQFIPGYFLALFIGIAGSTAIWTLSDYIFNSLISLFGKNREK